MTKLHYYTTLLFISCITLCFAKTNTDFMSYNEMNKVDHNLEQGLYDKAYDLILTKQKSYTERGINMTQVYFLWSKYYYYLGKVDKFKKYSKMAYNTSKQTNRNEIKAYGIYAMAFYSKVERDYKKTIEYLKAIEDIIKVENDPYLAYNIYYRYYSLYTSWEDIEKTDYYTQKLISIAKRNHNFQQLADAYIARSFAMEYLYDAGESKAYKDSILYFRQKAALLDKQYPGKVGIHTKSIAYLNLADYYTQGLEEGKFSIAKVKDSILKYTSLANQVTPLFDPNYLIRGNVLNLQASLYKSEGKMKQAEELLIEAYDKLHSTDSEEKHFYALRNVSGALYDFYKSTEDYKMANIYLMEYNMYNDSLFNINKIQEIADIEAQYEKDKMKARNNFLQSENKWKTTFNYLLITIFLLTALYYSSFVRILLRKLNFKS